MAHKPRKFRTKKHIFRREGAIKFELIDWSKSGHPGYRPVRGLGGTGLTVRDVPGGSWPKKALRRGRRFTRW